MGNHVIWFLGNLKDSVPDFGERREMQMRCQHHTVRGGECRGRLGGFRAGERQETIPRLVQRSSRVRAGHAHRPGQGPAPPLSVISARGPRSGPQDTGFANPTRLAKAPAEQVGQRNRGAPRARTVITRSADPGAPGRLELNLSRKQRHPERACLRGAGRQAPLPAPGTGRPISHCTDWSLLPLACIVALGGGEDRAATVTPRGRLPAVPDPRQDRHGGAWPRSGHDAPMSRC